MPNAAQWCQSETILRLSHTQSGNARIRIIALSNNNPMDEPDDSLIMELTIPEGTSHQILKEDDDPRIPTSFDVSTIDEGGDTYQIQCALHAELPDDLLDSTIRIFVQNQHKEILASYTFDTEIDDEGTADLDFVVTLRRENAQSAHQFDALSVVPSHWLPSSGAPDLTSDVPTMTVVMADA